jgi:hypothetical protein
MDGCRPSSGSRKGRRPRPTICWVVVEGEQLATNILQICGPAACPSERIWNPTASLKTTEYVPTQRASHLWRERNVFQHSFAELRLLPTSRLPTLSPRSLTHSASSFERERLPLSDVGPTHAVAMYSRSAADSCFMSSKRHFTTSPIDTMPWSRPCSTTGM